MAANDDNSMLEAAQHLDELCFIITHLGMETAKHFEKVLADNRSAFEGKAPIAQHYGAITAALFPAVMMAWRANLDEAAAQRLVAVMISHLYKGRKPERPTG